VRRLWPPVEGPLAERVSLERSNVECPRVSIEVQKPLILRRFVLLQPIEQSLGVGECSGKARLKVGIIVGIAWVIRRTLWLEP
jgi:hypothetical protein